MNYPSLKTRMLGKMVRKGSMPGGSESEPRDGDRVYDDLRNRILSLDLAPGVVLDESKIVHEAGVSRTPVREAIIRLVSEGLLVRDGRQIRVSLLEVAQLPAFFEALMLLIRATHRLAAARRTDSHLENIERLRLEFEKHAVNGDEAAMNEANHAFHLSIAAAAASPFLERAYNEILLASLRLSRQCFSMDDQPGDERTAHIERTIADHRAICAAIVARDPEEVDRLAEGHTELFKQRLARQLLGRSNQMGMLSLKGS